MQFCIHCRHVAASVAIRPKDARQVPAATICHAPCPGFLPRRGQGQQPTTKLDRPEDWFNALPTYMEGRAYHELVALKQVPKPGSESVWICPEAQEIAPLPTVYFAYGMNMGLSVWDRAKPDHLDHVGATSTMVFMADAPGSSCAVWPSARPFAPADRHQGFANIAFLDGHVDAFVRTDLISVDRSNIRWHVPDSSWTGPQD